MILVSNVTKYIPTAIIILFAAGRLVAGGPPLPGSLGPGDSVVVPGIVEFGTVPFDTCARKADTLQATLTNSGAMIIALSLKRGVAYQVIGKPIDTLDVRVRRLLPFTIQFCPTRDTTCPSDTLVVWYRAAADSLDTGNVKLVPITGCGMSNTPLLTAIPPQLDFGQPRPDSCVTRQVTLLGNPGTRVTARLSIQGHAANSFSIISPQTSPVTIDTSVVVTIQFCPQPGDASGADAFLRISNDTTGTSTPLLDVPLHGLTNPLRIPRLIDFGTIPAGSCMDTIIVVRNYLRRGITLHSWIPDTTLGRFTTNGNSIAQLAMGDSVPISLRFCPDSIGVRTGEWRLDTLPTGTVGIVSLTGRGGAASISITPDPLIFPTVKPPVTSCSDDTLLIVNTGNASFVIDTLLTDRFDFMFVPPLNLPSMVRPGETLRVALRFCPNTTGLVTASLRIGVAGNPTRTVTLIGQTDTSTGGNGLLVPTLPSIDFGTIPLGRSTTRTIVVRNQGNGPATLDTATVTPSPPFQIVGATGGGPIRPGDSIVLTIEFQPIDTGYVTGTWTGLTRNSSALTVLLSVRVVGHRLWADTVSIRVGREGAFSLHTSPPLSDRDTVIRMRALFSYDPRSIVPLSATSDVAIARLDQVDDSTVAIDLTAHPSQFITGGAPGSISFVGLTSGRPVSFVILIRDSLIGFSSSVATTPGVILLEGCDIGRDPGLSRATRVNSMRVTGTGELLLEYRTPLHASVRLVIVDLSGREAARIELPEGDDTDHAISIDLTGVPSGSYILDLQAGSDHSGSMIRIP